MLLCLFFVVPGALAQGGTPSIQIGIISIEKVVLFLAIGMSLFFDYFPGVAKKYEALDAYAKRLWAVGLAIFGVCLIYALTCFGVIGSNFICTVEGAWDVLTNIIYAIVVQYGFHQQTKPTVELQRRMFKE
jgi:hypothetical protein